MIASFSDACNFCVRYLVRSAYGMAANSVRPSDQPYPTGIEGGEFATVKVISLNSDFGTWSTSCVQDPTLGSTKLIEQLDNVYNFVASIQFFRHSSPSVDTAGLSPFGLSAVDKAARLGVMISSSPMEQLMETMGLGLVDCSQPRNVASLIDGVIWDDRGSVDITFCVVNRESILVATYGTVDVGLQIQEPGRPALATQTIEVIAP